MAKECETAAGGGGGCCWVVQPDAWLTEATEQAVKVFCLTFFAFFSRYFFSLCIFCPLNYSYLSFFIFCIPGLGIMFFLFTHFKLPYLIFCSFLASRRRGSSGGAGGRGGWVQGEGGRRCTFRGQGQLSQFPDAGTTQAELSHWPPFWVDSEKDTKPFQMVLRCALATVPDKEENPTVGSDCLEYSRSQKT